MDPLLAKLFEKLNNNYIFYASSNVLFSVSENRLVIINSRSEDVSHQRFAETPN